MAEPKAEEKRLLLRRKQLHLLHRLLFRRAGSAHSVDTKMLKAAPSAIAVVRQSKNNSESSVAKATELYFFPKYTYTYCKIVKYVI